MVNQLFSLRGWMLLLLAPAIISCSDNNNDDDEPVGDIPVALEAQEIFQTNFLANWEKTNDAAGYKIDVSTSADFGSFIDGFHEKDIENVNRCYVFGLNNQTKYYYRLKAYQSSGQSGYSNVVEVTTGGEDQLPNMGMEIWTEFPRYSVPAPLGVWATANKVADLLLYMNPPPVSTMPTTDAYAGEMAAKIMTILPPDFLLITGTVATGIFNPDLQHQLESLKQGIPFTSRPTAFKGYYKYYPVNNDSCDIYTILTRWDQGMNTRDTIARAIFKDNTLTIENYTEFFLPFTYLSAENPDSIRMIFASSAAGDLFIGGVGSTLYIDDLSLVY